MADMTIEEMEDKVRTARIRYDALVEQKRISDDFAGLLMVMTASRSISLELANNNTAVSMNGARALSDRSIPLWAAYKQEVYATVRAMLIDRMTQLAKETREAYEQTLRELADAPAPSVETERKPRGVKLRKKDVQTQQPAT